MVSIAKENELSICPPFEGLHDFDGELSVITYSRNTLSQRDYELIQSRMIWRAPPVELMIVERPLPMASCCAVVTL